ncbi:MAG: diaminopimelate epimerase [Clostridia bacterium]|nr:diaminopimelate epimerase [Clostridia bacterium]
MEFIKMHASGNDYVYLDYEKVKNYDLSLLSKLISNRHFGVGSDGLIAIQKLDDNTAKMIMYNADGSRGATCGNGVRCSAYFAKKYLNLTSNQIVMKTDVNETLVTLFEKNGSFYAKADMGEIKRVNSCEKVAKKLQEVGLYVDYRQVFEMNAGNRHLVFFYPNHSLFSLFKGVEKSRLFLDGINIERIYKIEQTKSSLTIYAEIYERGSGKTLSCGSGACAIFQAFLNFNSSNIRSANIVTEGGLLTVETDGEKTFLQSKIIEVFKGDLNENLISEAKR